MCRFVVLRSSLENGRQRLRWDSFSRDHLSTFMGEECGNLSGMTAGQMALLYKLNLVRLTSILEKYVPSVPLSSYWWVLCTSVSLSLCLSYCLCLCLSVSQSITPNYIAPVLSICLSLPLSHSIFLFLSLSVTIFVGLSLSLHLWRAYFIGMLIRWEHSQSMIADSHKGCMLTSMKPSSKHGSDVIVLEHVSMYVQMYMYAFFYVCRYICTFICTYVCLYVLIHALCMHLCMCVFIVWLVDCHMYVCMYVCIIYTCTYRGVHPSEPLKHSPL